MTLLPRVVTRDEMLATVLHPLDRPPEPERQPGNQNFLAVQLTTDAEAATNVNRQNPNEVLRVVEQVGERDPHEMRRLRRSPQR